MKSALRASPFPVTALHSSNVINQALAKFADTHKLRFTRTYRKDGSPYVESKNWSLVRSYAGYRRYDTKEELLALMQVDRLIALKPNLFMPTMKLAAKEKVGRGSVSATILTRRKTRKGPACSVSAIPDNRRGTCYRPSRFWEAVSYGSCLTHRPGRTRERCRSTTLTPQRRKTVSEVTRGRRSDRAYAAIRRSASSSPFVQYSELIAQRFREKGST